jgi:hypothetical protein
MPCKQSKLSRVPCHVDVDALVVVNYRKTMILRFSLLIKLFFVFNWVCYVSKLNYRI